MAASVANQAGETKPAHTPGPWFANVTTAPFWDIGPVDREYSQSLAAAHENSFLDIDAGVAEANARLIAAAPDLFGLLVRARVYVETCDDPGENPAGSLLAEIDAALAKAEGRS